MYGGLETQSSEPVGPTWCEILLLEQLASHQVQYIMITNTARQLAIAATDSPITLGLRKNHTTTIRDFQSHEAWRL
jgi:hypothetical protein